MKRLKIKERMIDKGMRNIQVGIENKKAHGGYVLTLNLEQLFGLSML